jgi:hypothetical protein
MRSLLLDETQLLYKKGNHNNIASTVNGMFYISDFFFNHPFHSADLSWQICYHLYDYITPERFRIKYRNDELNYTHGTNIFSSCH